MMKLIGYEIQKLFSRKLTILILVVLFGLNGILLHHAATEPLSETSPLNRIDIAMGYASCQGQGAHAIQKEMEDWFAAYQGLWYVDDDGNFHQPTQAQLDAMTVFTEKIGLDAGIRSAILNHVQALNGYESYLDSVQETAQRLSASSLYANENSFAHRNLKKTAQVYLPLYDVVLTTGDSSGVKLAFEGHTTTVLLLFAMVMIVLILTRAEREEGLLSLVKPTVHGRLGLIGAKIITLLLVLLVLTILFYSENLLLTGWLFGFENWGRSIQSLDGYLTSPWAITVGEYVPLFLFAKYLGLITAALVFFIACVVMPGRVAACITGAGILLIELGLYVGIPYHSYLSPLRQMNLAAGLDTVTFFCDYLNVNCFGFPVSISAASLAASAVIMSGSIWYSCRCWCREETIMAASRKKRKTRKVRISTSLLGHEAYKLLITCRGGLLLAVLILVQMFCYSGMNAYELESEIWYQQYVTQFRGAYSEVYLQAIQDALDWMESVYEQQAEYYAMADRGEISREYASYLAGKIEPSNSQEEALHRSKAQYDYLTAQREQGKQVSFLSTTEYNYLLDDEASDVFDSAKLSFVLAVCFSIYFTMEDTSGMMLLIRPSPMGKRKVLGRKLIVCCGYLIAVWAVSFLPRIFGSAAIYPLNDLDFPAASLPQFASMPDGISIGEALVLMNVSRLLGAVIVTIGIALLAVKIKNPTSVLIVSLLIQELPVFLNFLNVTGEILLLPLLTGHWMMAG